MVWLPSIHVLLKSRHSPPSKEIWILLHFLECQKFFWFGLCIDTISFLFSPQMYRYDCKQNNRIMQMRQKCFAINAKAPPIGRANSATALGFLLCAATDESDFLG